MKPRIRYIGMLMICAAMFSMMDSTAAQQTFMVKDGETIVFLGDSITQGASRPEGFIPLINLFCGVNGYEVKTINAGIGGHKSSDMLARLDRDVLKHNPDWVFISCGVNDVWHHARWEGIYLPDYKRNMAEIVDRCLKAGAKIILLTSTPIYENLNSEENKKLRTYNDFLKTLAKSRGIILCDLFAAFEKIYKVKMTDENLMTTDGVHMKPRGYRLMAREMLKALGASGRELALAENRWELVNNMQK